MAYYDHDELAFVHRSSSQLPAAEDDAFDEQRFYFANGRMIRWLRGTRDRNVAPGSPDYVGQEQKIRAIGARLIQGARADGMAISF